MQPRAAPETCAPPPLPQEQRQKAKAEKLAKIRAGEKGAVGAKPAEHKAISKKFYGQLVTDSHYVGDDYDVFGAWLGSKAKGVPFESSESGPADSSLLLSYAFRCVLPQ